MVFSDKDFIILTQNLLNRATDIEISNASVEKRKVDMENIKKNLGNLQDLFREQLINFSKR